MSCPPLSLPMSQIIAADAPLLSPVSDHSSWDIHPQLFSPTSDNFNFNYYTMPPSPPHSVASAASDSPVPPARMLKMRMSPDALSDSDQLCVPTHQLFDFHPPTPPSPASSIPNILKQQQQQHHHQHQQSQQQQQHHQPQLQSQHRAHSDSQSPAPVSSKRSASPTPGAPRKRTVGERISSKDFIPPDVSGLSKREARLVKNRAAAFLSRQRKREEFETMELRVSELEQENARLLALTQNGKSASPPKAQPENELVSEIEQLRTQLAAAKEREQQLSAELASKAVSKDVPVKLETSEAQLPLSSQSRSSSISSSQPKTAASLGLMQVLLCALPTLLSMPMHSTASTSFSIPNPYPPSSSPSSFDFNSYVPNEFDWSRTTGSSMMDLDSTPADASAYATQHLEFSTQGSDFGALGGLDISFDASRSDDGKIRVRIHPSSSASSRATSPSASFSSSKSETSASSPSPSMGMWSEAEPSFQAAFSTQTHSGSPAFSTPLSSGEDPFLGVGSSTDFGLPYSSDASSMIFDQMGNMSPSLEYGQMSENNFGLGSEFSVGDSTTGGKRRVRIALKSMPQTGGEGGEWEVQIC